MSGDKKSTRAIGDFLAGKGFYIILFVCVAVIGVSAYILLEAGNVIGGVPELDQFTMSDYEDYGISPEIGALDPGDSDGDDGSESAFNAEVGETPAVKTEPHPSPSPSASPSPSPSPSTTPAVKEEPKTDNTAKPEQKTIKDLSFMWPVAGKVEVIFAVEELVYNKTMADWRTHPGVDISASIGSKVLAVADGTVTNIYTDDMLGTTVEIDHGFGLTSVYSNLSSIPVAKVGDKITMGAVLGSVGDTAVGEIGQVSHLHFEMRRDGNHVDPADYLPSK